MNFTPCNRTFEVGNVARFAMHDCGRLHLEPDEQVTLVTAAGAEFDVARKDFGFYATPSLNGRLPSFGLRAVLVKNPSGRYFVLLVESGREETFAAYLEQEIMTVVCWLDSTGNLQALEAALAAVREADHGR